ncbi:MAG: AAA family ATPase [Candidatus Electronema sp. V4]|uniref:AAA family ATPase n=1 Tax=Candidatus Electronema sp. V4 TaxID=3454756 RepID=UPI0040553BCF
MHLEYFGLAKPPFVGEPDTEIFFPEADRTALLRRIYAELQNGSPVVRLTGAEGSGKSLLCLLLAHLLPAHFQAVYLASPAGSFDELLRAACQELGQPPQADMPAWLRRQMEQCQAQGKKFLLLIDQAELMFPAALERLLRTAFTAAEQQTLQVILVGRPALNERISQLQAYCADIEMPPSHQLAPLTEEELAAYLSFRLKAAGLSAADSVKAFSGEATRKIFELAKGNLRAAHLLADTALQRVCAADRYFPVLAADVTALKDGSSGGRVKQKAALSSRTWKLLAAAVLLLFAALLFRYSDELWRNSEDAAKKMVSTVPVKPTELLPDKIRLNSETELPPEPEAAEPVAEIAEAEPVLPTEPMEEPPAAAQVAAVPADTQVLPAPPQEETEEQVLEEEPLETPPALPPVQTPPPAPQQTKIVQLSPGMRKTRPKAKDSAPAIAPPPPPAPTPEPAAAPEQRAEINADRLYQELLAAGGLLRKSRSAGRYTVQLATLASPEAAKEMIVRDEYLEHRSQLKLLRRPSPASPTFIFYGSYGSLEEAQAAVSQMPLFLRKQHHPAAVPVAEALGKVGN